MVTNCSGDQIYPVSISSSEVGGALRQIAHKIRYRLHFQREKEYTGKLSFYRRCMTETKTFLPANFSFSHEDP